MTYAEFFGCLCLTFGPPLAMFLLTIAHDPIRILIIIAAAFCWMLSILISSLIWFIVVPLRDELAFGLVFSVCFQVRNLNATVYSMTNTFSIIIQY